VVRIGLIGLGRHGIRYARHLANRDVDRAALACVWRRDRTQGEADAKVLGTRFCPRIEDVIEASDVDAVVSAVPVRANLDVALITANAKKPLLLEKPIARTVHEAARIVEAFRTAHRPLMVAQTLRFDPLVLRLKARLEAIGGLCGFSFEQRIEPRGLAWEDDPEISGGGVLMQTAIHTLDALRFVTQSDRIRVVHALTTRMHYRRNEDHALVQLAIGTGNEEGAIIGQVAVSKIGRSRLVRFGLHLESCALEADLVHRRFCEIRDREIGAIDVPEAPTIPAVLSAFVDCIEQRTPNPITGEDAMRSLALVEAAYALART
jgi:predicted dehydrogenase